jgi:hypothetical protein
MQRQSALWLALAMVASLALPTGASAQEEEDAPAVLRLSFFKCNFGGGAGDRIEAELENQVIPVWKELVSEGMIQDYGIFYHWWADEWNMGIYTIASTIQAILDAEGAAAERLEERFGEAESAQGQACPEHKDGFYTIGPSAGMQGDGN